MGWVIIPDIHGDTGRLCRTMAAAGFRAHGDGFRHPDGVKALFLGDLIDNGPDNAGVIRAVRATVDDGEGICLMGNHELNALLLHSGHRERSPKNLRQHEAFLREMPLGSREADDAVAWFSALPLRADLGHFRAAHAFWGDEAALAGLPTARQHGALLTMLDTGLLAEIGAESGAAASAVLDVTKGPEIALPAGDYGFSDHYGHWRTKGRLRWWGGPEFEGWDDALISVGPDARLPLGRPGAEVAARAYDPSAPTLLIGHYKMRGEVTPISPNVVCLDFPDEEPFCEAGAAGIEIRDAGEGRLEM